MNVCPICVASLSHRTVCMGYFSLVPITMYTCFVYFTGWQKKKKITKKKLNKKYCVTAPILKPTYDQKLERFFLCVSIGTLIVSFLKGKQLLCNEIFKYFKLGLTVEKSRNEFMAGPTINSFWYICTIKPRFSQLFWEICNFTAFFPPFFK